ncbi:MAG: DUF7010 family protein [Chryseotalea sp.]|jgi:hypothetical protein
METLTEQKIKLGQTNLRGLAFLLAASLYWLSMGCLAIFTSTKVAFTFSLWGGGLTLPLAMLFTKMLGTTLGGKGDLSTLGLLANVFQLLFFPMAISLGFSYGYHYLPLALSLLMGAHFIFYGWLYNSKTYYIICGVSVLFTYWVWFITPQQTFVYLGFFNFVLLNAGVVGLMMENNASIKKLNETLKEYPANL